MNKQKIVKGGAGGTILYKTKLCKLGKIKIKGSSGVSTN